MIKTKQELLNHFTDINAMYNNPFMYQTLSNMIDELLEQQLCEEYISRQEIIDEIDRYIEKAQSTGTKDDFISFQELIVKQLPSVTPQRKRGKWIEIEICNCHAALRCSVCDRVIEPTFTFGEYSYESIKKWYPFCHCGADMRGEDDDE